MSDDRFAGFPTQPSNVPTSNPYGNGPAPAVAPVQPSGQPYGQLAQPHGIYPGQAPGKIRGTGVCTALTIVTFGLYSLVWFYQTHEEMKRYTGQGLGGGVALILAFFVGIVMPYITSSEVGALYERAGQHKPVSGATGLWNFPGVLILVGPLIWFVKTNGALNAYWRAQGVR